MMVEEPELDPVAAPQPLDYAKGLAWTMGFNAIMKITLGVVAIYIARRLGPGEMGMFGLLSSIYIFAEQMREAGLKQAFYNDNAVSPAKFRTYARMSVISGLTFAIVLVAMSVPLSRFFGVPELAWSVSWAAIATLLNGLSVIPMAALHKSGRFRDIGLIETSANFVAAGTSLALVLSGWGFGALVAQLVVRSTVLFSLAYWQKPYSIFNHDREASRQIFRVCTPLVTTDLLWLSYALIDQFAIMKLLTYKYGIVAAKEAAGFYQQGRKLLGIPADFLYFPLVRTFVVAAGNRNENPAELGRTFLKATNLAVVLLAAMFGACAALGTPLVLAAYTSKFAGTIPIFGIICLSEAFKLTGGFAGSALVAAGRSRIPMYSWLLPYPIMAAGIYLSWPHLSLVSIVWSYSAGIIAVSTLVMFCAFRYLEVQRKQVIRFWECVAVAGFTTLIAYGISFIPLDPWPHVFLGLVTIPVLHALVIGTVFARNPVAYLNRNGLRKLRESL